MMQGHCFAFADPASTSGHLFPAYWLAKNGLDPDKGIRRRLCRLVRG